jgi:hypothetical protein
MALPNWHPTAPAVTDADFLSCPVVILHYWAVWNWGDVDMDIRLALLRREYADRICFRSCDTDQEANQRFVAGVGNLPALGCFVGGKWMQTLIGLRSEQHLRAAFDPWLAGQRVPR